MHAPIALFVYNRPDLMRRTLATLAANTLAAKSELFIFCDGPKHPGEAAEIAEVRAVANGVNGFARASLVAAPANQGLSRSIIGGVTRLTREFGRVIVLEDDIITSPYFLEFMNNALEKYKEDQRVAAISGYLPPFDATMADTFFQRDAECWGWATWDRAWNLFDPDGAALLDELRRRRLLRFFDQDGTSNYVEMLKRQIAGRNDSWAVRWRASVILANKLSLYPGRSLTQNIGFDGSGTHSDKSSIWKVDVSPSPVVLNDIAVAHSQEGFEAFKRFNQIHGINSLGRRLRGHVKALLRRTGFG